MNGPLGNLASFCAGTLRLAWLGHVRPVTGAEAGGTGRAAQPGEIAGGRPLGEIIARRAVRCGNRQPDAAARFERVHTILSRGRE